MNDIVRDERDVFVRFVGGRAGIDIRVITAEELNWNNEARLGGRRDEWRVERVWEGGNGGIGMRVWYRSGESGREKVWEGEIRRERGEWRIYGVKLIVEEGEVHDSRLRVTFKYIEGSRIEEARKENMRRGREVVGIAVVREGRSLEERIREGEMMVWREEMDWGWMMWYEIDRVVKGIEYRVIKVYKKEIGAMRIKREEVEEGKRYGNEVLLGEEIVVDRGERGIKEIVWKVMRGEDLTEIKRKRRVVNLGGGITGYRNPGVVELNERGLTIVANGQRIAWTNDEEEKYWNAEVATIGRGGEGLKRASITLLEQEGEGYFSLDNTKHKVYREIDGSEISSRGRWINQGRLLTWETSDLGIVEGERVYICPAIVYRRASVFKEPVIEIKKVYRNGIEIDPRNVIKGVDMFDSYREPYGELKYWIVTGEERNGFHYILRKNVYTADGDGKIKTQGKGNILFIKGINEVINRPVVRGLTPGISYEVLEFHAPMQQEHWQIEYVTRENPGIGRLTEERTELTRETWTIEELYFAFIKNYTNNYIFLVSRDALVPLEKVLPFHSSLNTHLVKGIIEKENTSILETKILGAVKYVLPKEGEKIRFRVKGAQYRERSLDCEITDERGNLLGLRMIEEEYVGFILGMKIRSRSKNRYIICHGVGEKNEEIPLTSDKVAIEVYKYYD